MKRLEDLYRDIDAIMANNEYYDDDTEETVCEISEDDVYKIITEQKDYKFLTAKVIKEEIHKCFISYEYRVSWGHRCK